MTAVEFNSQFKAGDILVVGAEEVLILFAELDSVTYESFDIPIHILKYHALMYKDDTSFIKINMSPRPGLGFIEEYKKIVKAPNARKKIFFDALEKEGLRWDAENKQFIGIEHGEG
jgi:hypothetical protein